LSYWADRLNRSKIALTEALRIHLRALRLVGEPDGPTGEEGRRIVDDLLALRRSLGLPE
jgi:hypothetical protein